MKKHIGIAASLVLSVLLLAAMACQSSDESTPPASAPESPNSSAPAPTATPESKIVDIDNGAVETTTTVIAGTVTYRERFALSEAAVLIVKLVDVSRADAPFITIGEYEMANPGQVPLSFKIEYDPSDIDERFTYAVQARINEGETLSFINDTRYNVITRDNPTSVDMVLVKIVALPPVIDGPPLADIEQIEEPPAIEYVEAPAPIESVEVVESDGAYTLHIVSGLPGGCAEFSGIELSRDGNTIAVTVSNLVPAPNALVACTMIYGYHETNVELGESITAGETYTVVVNGDATTDFVASETGAGETVGPETVETPAPIESVEVIESDGTYTLHIVSGLPGGCAEFSGSELIRDGNTIAVTVNNLVPAPGVLVACTMIYGYHETDIELSDLNPGETYTVVVNGDVTTDFVASETDASEADGPETVETPAPIESVEVIVTEDGAYTLHIVSGLPGGCAAHNGFELTRDGNIIEVIVDNLVPVPGVLVMCTAIYGYHETDIELSDLTAGENYTVVVNGKVTNGFVARDPEGPAMAEHESPIEVVELTVTESGEYVLNIVSRLPMGSSCSSFNGYDVSRRFASTIEVTVTYLGVTEIMPCTEDLPIVDTAISLGSDFSSGETYKIIVNGETTKEFEAK